MELLEDLDILDGIVDRRGGKERIETTACGGRVVCCEDCFGDGLLGEDLIFFGCDFAFGFVVIYMEAEDILIFDCMGDCVGVEFFLEEVFRGSHRFLFAFDLLLRGVFLEDGRACKAEELRVGEELFD